MPDITIPMTNAQAARVTVAFAKIPDRFGNLPPENATNAVKWAHVKRVLVMLIRLNVYDYEKYLDDPEMDALDG